MANLLWILYPSMLRIMVCILIKTCRNFTYMKDLEEFLECINEI